MLTFSQNRSVCSLNIIVKIVPKAAIYHSSPFLWSKKIFASESSLPWWSLKVKLSCALLTSGKAAYNYIYILLKILDFGTTFTCSYERLLDKIKQLGSSKMSTSHQNSKYFFHLLELTVGPLKTIADDFLGAPPGIRYLQLKTLESRKSVYWHYTLTCSFTHSFLAG